MDNILSIDLDILMTPYIGIYNSLIRNTYNCEAIWRNMLKYFNISDFNLNMKYYNIISSIILNYMDKVDTIYIGQDHSSILSAINYEQLKFQKPYQFTIYNIDYHHDIAYGEQAVEFLQYGIVGCADWVGFLQQNNFLKNYYWYTGEGAMFDSYMFDNKFKSLIPPTFNNYLLTKDFPMDLNIKMFYIALSLPWIPPHCYDFLVEILININHDKIKYITSGYQNGNLKAPFLSLPGEKGYSIFNFLS